MSREADGGFERKKEYDVGRRRVGKKKRAKPEASIPTLTLVRAPIVFAPDTVCFAKKVVRFCLFPSRSPEAFSLADISGWYVHTYVRDKKIEKAFLLANAAQKLRLAATPIYT